MDVGYKLSVGALLGVVLGSLLARLIIALPAQDQLEKTMIGLGSVFSTLLVYGVTEYAGAYGFVAVFLAGIIIRSYERHHDYHRIMHVFSEAVERIITAVIVVGFGAAIAQGVLTPLTWPLVLCALLIVFAVRPVCGLVALVGSRMSWPERWAVSFFGIRGIGSLYYLSFALNKQRFDDAEELWALVALVMVISISVHGVLAAPALRYVGRMRKSG